MRSPPYLDEKSRLAGATTHDTFLRAGVELGIPDLLIYVALTLMAGREALIRLRRGSDEGAALLAAVVLGIIVGEFGGTLLFSGASFAGFWFAMSLGLLVAQPCGGPEAHTRTWLAVPTATQLPPQPEGR